MTTKKFLNNEEKRLMLEMRNQGVKVAQIASILKVKESTVYAALKRAKLRAELAASLPVKVHISTIRRALRKMA